MQGGIRVRRAPHLQQLWGVQRGLQPRRPRRPQHATVLRATLAIGGDNPELIRTIRYQILLMKKTAFWQPWWLQQADKTDLIIPNAPKTYWAGKTAFLAALMLITGVRKPWYFLMPQNLKLVILTALKSTVGCDSPRNVLTSSFRETLVKVMSLSCICLLTFLSISIKWICQNCLLGWMYLDTYNLTVG